MALGIMIVLQLTRTLACETLWIKQLDLGVPGQQSQ